MEIIVGLQYPVLNYYCVDSNEVDALDGIQQFRANSDNFSFSFSFEKCYSKLLF